MDATENPYASPEPVGEPQRGISDLLEARIDPEQAIIAEGPLTEEEFYASLKLHRPSRRYFMAALLLAALLFVGRNVQDGFAQGRLPVTQLMFGTLLLFFLLLNLFPRLGGRRTWRASASLREPVRRLITPDLIQSIGSSSNVLLRWRAYSRYRRSDRVVLLYLAEQLQIYNVIGRSSFSSDADWQRFVEIVKENLPRG